jgi:hypothetical protein
VQRLTTRGEHRQAWAAAKQAIHQLCASFNEVLAVVDDDQTFESRQLFQQGVDHRARLDFSDLESGGKRVRQELTVAERSKLDQARSIGLQASDPGRHFQREARLSAAGGAGQRDQARPADKLTDLSQLTLPADKPAGVNGQRSIRLLGSWPPHGQTLSAHSKRVKGAAAGRPRPLIKN